MKPPSSWESFRATVVVGGVLSCSAFVSGCASSSSAQSCSITSDTGIEYVLTANGNALTIAQQDGQELHEISSIGQAQAVQGAIVFGIADAGTTLIVLGPEEMSGVSVSGGLEEAATNCESPALAVAAIGVTSGATLTVEGKAADDDLLFSRTELVPDNGSAVLAPIGPPPTT